MNVLIEATGSLISGYLIKSICSDISDFGHAPSECDEFYISPEVSDPRYWEKGEKFALDSGMKFQKGL